MKKITALLLGFLLLMTLVPAGMAEEDFSFHREALEENETLEISVDEEGDAFVSGVLSAEDLSFSHRYEHPDYYSYPRFDMLIFDYNSQEPVAVSRLWVYYAGVKPLHTQSITFRIGEEEFTFEDVYDPEKVTEDENGVREDLLIIFGLPHLSFLTNLDVYIDENEEAISRALAGEEAFVPDIAMTLHGDEEMEIQLGLPFLLDFMSFADGLIESNAMADLIEETDMNPMTSK